jgi:ornithine--oxo-acid transaminase
MCYDHEGIKPDIVTIGKALSGGFLPSSAAMANDDIMLLIKPGEHGSTFGGNPLASAISKRAVEILFEENMIENSRLMGELLLKELQPSADNEMIVSVRGRGLFCSVEVNKDARVDGAQLAIELMKRGLATKQTHGTTIRLAPALTINEQQIKEGA